MSQKVTQGKVGIVGSKKSEQLTISHGVVSDSQDKSGLNETESMASEMETVYIRGTDFAKEFEKPNDRASHIKIGRAKQKIVSGNPGTILTSVSLTSGHARNDGKPSGTTQKTTVAQLVETAAKATDGPCRTSDLEGSAANSFSAVKTGSKKTSITCVNTVTTNSAATGVTRKAGNFTGRANTHIAKLGNADCISKENNTLSRPSSTVPIRPSDVSANIRPNSGFSNIRLGIPGNVFPGSPRPRGRGPGANFNPPRQAVCVPGNLFNTGRPSVPVANVRNTRQMDIVGKFTPARPVGGIPPRPSGIGIPPRPTGIGIPPRPTGIGIPPRPTGTGIAPRPTGTGIAPRPTGTGIAPRPTGTGIAPRPTGTGIAPRPTGTGIAPRPTGTGIAPRPTGTGIAPRPTGTGISPRPTGTGISPRPTGTGISPRPSGTGISPRPSGTGISPRPSGTGISPRPTGTGISPRPTGTGISPRPTGTGISPRPTGTGSVKPVSRCSENKTNELARPIVSNVALNQRITGSDKQSGKPNSNNSNTTASKILGSDGNSCNTNSVVDALKTKNDSDKKNIESKTIMNVTSTGIDSGGPNKPDNTKKLNHGTGKPCDSNLVCVTENIKANTNVVTNASSHKTSSKPITSNSVYLSDNGKLVSNHTAITNKSPKSTRNIPGNLTGAGSITTVDGIALQNQSSEREQNPVESISTEDNSDALDDSEGSKGGISFSFNRKMGQKLASSVPFSKEEEKSKNSGDIEKDPKSNATNQEQTDGLLKNVTENAPENQSNVKDLPSAGMSFLKVLNKEQTVELDWPVEMIQYTKTQPSISFSCNPLVFDFSELLPKNKSQKIEDANKSKLKQKSDEVSIALKGEVNSLEGKEDKHILNIDDVKEDKSLVRKSKKKKRKLSSQRHSEEDEPKSKKKKKKKHKKKDHKNEDGTSEKDDDKNPSTEPGKSKKHKKKKKKRSHHSGLKSDIEQGDGEGGLRSKSSHKSKHKKHKSRKSKKKRHKHDDFEKDSHSGHESEDLATGSNVDQKSKRHKKEKSSLSRKDSSNISSEEEAIGSDKVSKVHKTKGKVTEVDKVESNEQDLKHSTAVAQVCEDEKVDLNKKRTLGSNNPGPLFESIDDSKKLKKEETSSVKAGSSTERKRNSGDIDSPVNSKKKTLKNPGMKSEDTWSKMETIFEARSDPEGNKASWDTSSDSDVESPVNNSSLKSKNNDGGSKRKKGGDQSVQTDKKESSHNPCKSSLNTSKVDTGIENYHHSSGSDSDHAPSSAKKSYKRKKSYSGESHHSDSHCRSRDRSYSSSYSDRDSHYSDKSKHRHSRSHSSSNSRSRSRSRSVSYERHGPHRGRRYSYSSYSDDDYRYRRGHSPSRSCSRHRSRTRSRSYNRSRRYRSYSSEHRSYTSSSSRSRSRSESRGRSRSYSYSRSHSKSSSYSRSRSRSRSYHKSRSTSRSPHKSAKQEYRHKSSPERRYSSYTSKKNSRSVQGKKAENEKSGKLDPAKIPLPIMPGDCKDEVCDQFEKNKDKKLPSDISKPGTSAIGAETISNIPTSKNDLVGQSGTREPESKSSGLINIPLPPFQVAENAQLVKTEGVENQMFPPPPPPHVLSLTRFPGPSDNLLHSLPDLSQPPPSTSIMTNCPPPPPPPPPPMINSNLPGMQASRIGASSLYGHLGLPPRDATRMNAPPPPPPPKCGVDASMRMPLPFTPRSVTRLEQTKECGNIHKSPMEQSMQSLQATSMMPLNAEAVEKEMTPPLPPPKSPPPQPPPPPKKEDDKKGCEEISPMPLPIIPPEQAEQYKHLQEMAQKHAQRQQRRQLQKEIGQVEESDDDESMEMEGQVSTMLSDEENDEQPGILTMPEHEPHHLQQQILLQQHQHAGSPVIAHPMMPFSQQQQIVIPQSALLQSQGTFPIQAGGPVFAFPHGAAHHHHHHHPHHALAGHHALHPHHLHPAAAAAAAAAGMPIAAASHPFHHQLIASPSQLMPYASHQPLLTQIHPPGSIIIGHQVLIPRFPRAPI